ncbi:MAG: 2-succinyl-5-enolpyruvyl-6-hydroxy-3-cyclohexene-1-carboxylic-acid synthase [Bacteroidales bacterium]|nr:2-succinyl-5-enolpyruvyl-6-hydroxy-3-cyclohexene-1-carboxylic-acid synthase [Bacteroidales bacterium]
MSKGKEQIGLLAALMIQKGITQVVASPGSRNAPAIIMFAQHKSLKLISIADERSAGFFALGMAIKTRNPVALLCTSGTAPLNYAPAIAEAYYQKIPLLVITADRPKEWIDQGDGQTIRQENIFANYIRKSFSLPSVAETPESQWFANRIINEAIDRCRYPEAGPVHLNLPIAEPLYRIELNEPLPRFRTISIASIEKKISPDQMKKLAQQWNGAFSKLILIGQVAEGVNISRLLTRLSEDPSVVIMMETTSNIHHPKFINCIDRVIDGIDGAEIEKLKPEILLTFDGAIVSKKIKALLRKMKPEVHWHVSPDPDEFHTDTYQSLTLTIPVSAGSFIAQLTETFSPVTSEYHLNWLERSSVRRNLHHQFIRKVEFCDMQVYDILFGKIPEGTDIHLANSTPVRYAQLFDLNGKQHFYSNRGTSGIDGCVSTAAGSAYVSTNPITVISGDIGFLYDSNALWNVNLKPDFRIVVINNGGGNIFRILEGPSDFEQLEPYIETVHQFNVQGMAANFGLDYFQATDKQTLEEMLVRFYDYSHGKAAILEIITPNILSANVLKEYFKFLNS